MCERGFELLGPARRVCENGQWTPEGIPFCGKCIFVIFVICILVNVCQNRNGSMTPLTTFECFILKQYFICLVVPYSVKTLAPPYRTAVLKHQSRAVVLTISSYSASSR